MQMITLLSLTRRLRIWFEPNRDLIELTIIRLVRRGVGWMIPWSEEVSWRGRRGMGIWFKVGSEG